MVHNTQYKNRKIELNELTNLIFDNKNKLIVYHADRAVGMTSFFSRAQWLFQSTQDIQIFSAELSKDVHSPIHRIVSQLTVHDNKLYQQLQLFSDEAYGQSDDLILAAIKDISGLNETISALTEVNKAVPIYVGFYADRLKDVFFTLVQNLSQSKNIIIFIDNAQYINNDSIYDILALLAISHVKIVVSVSGSGEYFDKLYLECKYKFPTLDINFPSPDIAYVQELGTLYNSSVDSVTAKKILSSSNKDIRKILNLLNDMNNNNKCISKSELDRIIIQILSVWHDSITSDTILRILNYTPYSNIYDIQDIEHSTESLKDLGEISCIYSLRESQNQYSLISSNDAHFTHAVNDIADMFVIRKAVLEYYNSLSDLTYEHNVNAYSLSVELQEDTFALHYAKRVICLSLKLGLPINNKWINQLKHNMNKQNTFLLAICYFCGLKYQKAKEMLELYFQNNEYTRDAMIIYAITLNRCRLHLQSQNVLTSLIKTSKDIDELTVLVSYLISNNVHSNKLEHGIDNFNSYKTKLCNSSKYPYFLRNSATMFGRDKAYELRRAAADIFLSQKDLFGYYSTISNMASYYCHKHPSDFAVNKLKMAFDGLQQFGERQLHIVSNNLGVCYLIDGDYVNAEKYFGLSIFISKSIMPKAYATMNMSAMFVKKNESMRALSSLNALYKPIISSNLHRLKSKYFLYLSVINYVTGNWDEAIKYCNITNNQQHILSAKQVSTILNTIRTNIERNIRYSDELWDILYAPCFLEYWTISPIDVLSNDILTL